MDDDDSPIFATTSGANQPIDRAPSPSWSALPAIQPPNPSTVDDTTSSLPLSSQQVPGGFIRPTQYPPQVTQPPLSPPASSIASYSASLPHPRSQPLRPGSNKEEITRRYVEDKLLDISRRYVKKFAPAEEQTSTTPGFGAGYKTFGEAAKDLSDVVDVLWRSGTPALQVPYLLNVAGVVGDYVGAFAPEPQPTLSLLRKLDFAFACLLEGKDMDTGESLPGFEKGIAAGLSRTDMVRLKSLAEGTRIHILEVLSRPEDLKTDSKEETDVDMDQTDTEADTCDESASKPSTRWYQDDDEEDEQNMDVARVYEMTLMMIDQKLNRGVSYDVGQVPTWEENGMFG